jgi:hypothetical protein
MRSRIYPGNVRVVTKKQEVIALEAEFVWGSGALRIPIPFGILRFKWLTMNFPPVDV